ncbi:hydroxyacid dehydrogenase [Candidatus Atribacteria bacterium HGW-Atribacteria-1]|nr:MAG: hydroxyacid dehydrogenase [Candidatus Atribacteria bacterium HGW-Atribacteria-1]
MKVIKNVIISAPYMHLEKDKIQKKLNKYEDKINFIWAEVEEGLEEKDLLKMIEGIDGIMCGNDKFTKNVIDKAKKLKIISKWGTGIDSIDKKYANRKGIIVCNTPNAFTEPVADTTLGMILNFARNISFTDDEMKKGNWKKMRCKSLCELTLGIIGLGNIGKAVAKRASAFGMKILGNDIKQIDKNFLQKYQIDFVDKKTIYKKADFVTLHCTLNETSYHLITKKELELMGTKTFLINTARGALIKTEDLEGAILNKVIAGVALDVFESEPLEIDSIFRKYKNCVVSPHNANNSPYFWNKVHDNTIKNLIEGLGVKYYE